MAWFPAGVPITAGRLNSLILTAYKTADQSRNNTTTMANDTELVVALEANTTYRIDLFLVYQTNDTAKLKIGWSGPSGATMRWGGGGIGSGVTAVTGDILMQLRTGSEQAVLGGGGNNNLIANPTGTIRTGVTAGDLQFQWAPNALDPGNTIVRLGSMLTLIKAA